MNEQRQARSNKLPMIFAGLALLLIVGVVAGILIFRNVLRPGQQQRVIDMLPFMTTFVNRPAPDATLPTIEPPVDGAMSAEDLLNAPLFDELDESAETEEPGALEASYLPTKSTLMKSARPAVYQVDTTGESLQTPLPRDARMYGFRHVQQTWNNCGPANITQVLSYYGWQEDQSVAASVIRPNREDKNVSPAELVRYVNENTGVRAITRYGGTLELLKMLMANEFPVIIETSYAPEGYDWIGHYRTVVGYDDNQQIFYVYDTYLGSGEAGEGITLSYQEIDTHWQDFNRVFLVIYTAERESELQAVLGDYSNPVSAAEIALATAQQEARANQQNKFAWFNMGTSLVRLGRYEEAAAAFDRAIQLELPFRMLWYQFGPYEAYYNVERYDSILALVQSSVSGGGNYVEETHYWQGRALEALGRRGEAADAYRRALATNSTFTLAQEALDQINREGI